MKERAVSFRVVPMDAHVFRKATKPRDPNGVKRKKGKREREKKKRKITVSFGQINS